MGKSHFSFPISMLKFTNLPKLDTSNINVTNKGGRKQPNLKAYVVPKRYRCNRKGALPTLKFKLL